jgi:hypothetical protein
MNSPGFIIFSWRIESTAQIALRALAKPKLLEALFDLSPSERACCNAFWPDLPL